MIRQPLKQTQIILWRHISVIIDAGPRNRLSPAAQVVFSAATGTESLVFPVPLIFQLSMPEEENHR